jgi:hypothetical protein
MIVKSVSVQQARVLGSDAAVAVGRFSPLGVTGYRPKDGGPLRAIRVEAEADQRTALDHQRTTSQNPSAPASRGAEGGGEQ